MNTLECPRAEVCIVLGRMRTRSARLHAGCSCTPEAEEATGMHAAVKLNKIELQPVLPRVLQGIFPQLHPDRGRDLPDLSLFCPALALAALLYPAGLVSVTKIHYS